MRNWIFGKRELQDYLQEVKESEVAKISRCDQRELDNIDIDNCLVRPVSIRFSAKVHRTTQKPIPAEEFPSMNRYGVEEGKSYKKPLWFLLFLLQAILAY